MNNRNFASFTGLYFFLALVEISLEFFELKQAIYFTKPLLMILLGGYFYSQVKNIFTGFAKLILFAIFFSWLGDVFLMFTDRGEMFFIAGLVAFLLAHVFYIIGFIRNIKQSTQKLKAGTIISATAPFLIFSSLFFACICDKLGDMLIPVSVYTLVITMMGISAALRHKSTGQRSYNMVLIGAILFILSDSTIALNKFIYEGELPMARVLIMTTYLTAQYLIGIGSLIHLRKKHPEELD